MATLNDTFDRGDDTVLGTASGGFTWAESGAGTWSIASNLAQVTSGFPSYARADSDLSGDDNYSQLVFSTLSSGYGGPICRMSSGSITDGYAYRWEGGTSHKLYKIVSGTVTEIGSGTSAISNGDTVRVSAEGTAIKVLINGTPVIEITDSAIATGVRCGMWAANGFSGPFNNFEAGDMGAAPTPLSPPIFRRQRRFFKGR